MMGLLANRFIPARATDRPMSLHQPAPRTHQRGTEALAFLVVHRLPPTPHNYMLAYLVLNEPDSAIARAVNAITDGRIRIRQADADKIICLHGNGNAVSGLTDMVAAERDAVRHQTLRLGDMASSAAAASEAFTADLNAEADMLSADTVNTVQILARMIERSRRAEHDLKAAADRVEALRQELDAARGDAERDQLTGLANRRGIERRLRTLADDGRDCAIGLCDVDHFKSINDRFGHVVGDRVLMQIGSVLAAACAPHLVGRWGGEEFLIVLEDRTEHEGIKVLDRARADLVSHDFKVRETNEPIGRVSFSAGVAVAQGDYEDRIAAIRKADVILYRAKAAGRNCVFGS
ncbi:sensor domain-containing diguanylate cyclase [Sphingomonas montana]|uniref:GGDEF domain-containing protein n=1 Tax=Sphingomonas montana TaxID=1843236 RepID=UPI00101AD446|nr:GGDEF domain-containing protein [Sphingomonas montana]